MRIILNNFAQSTPQGSSVNISRAMSDPVPTCSVTLVDNTSTITVPPLAELLVLDDQLAPNPTINYLQNPSLNPYTSFWSVASFTGITLSQVGGGGVNIAVNNTAAGTDAVFSQFTFRTQVVAGQTYMFSAYVQGSNTPTNVGAYMAIEWQDAAGVVISTTSFLGPTPASTTLTRYNVSGVAPANVALAQIKFGVRTTSGTNSGTVTFTQVQFEPQWFADIPYPTPFCGPGQPNCTLLPAIFTYIRQYRRFAGCVTHITNGDYRGDVRDVAIEAVGYAWIFGTVLSNASFTNQFDSAIIASLLSSLSLGMFSTTNVVQGVQLSSLQANWDDLRSIIDNLASQSGYYWTVDFYWNVIYAPPGYITMPISLICDNSGIPDMVTTFSAYNISVETDYTQPGSSILVIGSGSNVAQVIDPQTVFTNMLQFTGGAWSGTSGNFHLMRKVNESTLQSITDCVNRGIAELLQYDYARNLYHLSTNVELIAGQGIRVTSDTDGLNNTTLLIQSVTASWLGKNELLQDVWEYQADLGAVNRAATNIISRLARLSNENSSAPAITQTSLVVVERLGVLDSVSTGSTATGYAPTILGDAPVGYYRLNEKIGTIADDLSGKANNGTLAGGITLGVTGLLTSGGDTAMTFNGTSGIITLPTSMVPTGTSPWSLECWFKIASIPASGFPTLMGWGNNTGNQRFGVLNLKTNGGTSTQVVFSTNNGDIQSGNLSINTVYHAVGTYDGTATRLYLNGSLVAGPTNFTLNLAQALCSIGAFTAYGSSFFPATIDEVAFYTYALNSTQISNHYTVGTT